MPAAYRGVKLAVYNSAELKQGLGSSQTFSQAVQELEVVVGHFEHLQKDTQVAAVADLRTAVEYQESCLEHQEGLASLLRTAKMVLPQKRWAAVDRLCRARGIDLARAGRKAAGQSQAAWQVDWLQLPQTALEALLQRLDPATLGRALCCCREWRRLGSHRALWEPHLLRLFPGHPADDPGQGALPVHVQFARLAADEPLHMRQLWASHRYLKGHASLYWGSSHAGYSDHKPQASEVLDLLHDLSGRQLSDSDTESDVSTSSSDNGRIAPAGIQAYSGPARSSATLQ